MMSERFSGITVLEAKKFKQELEEYLELVIVELYQEGESASIYITDLYDLMRSWWLVLNQ